MERGQTKKHADALMQQICDYNGKVSGRSAKHVWWSNRGCVEEHMRAESAERTLLYDVTKNFSKINMA